MERRFRFGYCIRVAGPSQCGKTATLLKLLSNFTLFDPHPPKRVVWVSGSGVIDQQLEEKIKSLYPNSVFIYHVPEQDELIQNIQEHDFWCFDDLASELQNNKTFTSFCTKLCHHYNILMAYLTQNAYEKGSDATTRARNSAYQIYFPNRADVRWERVLGDQLLGNAKCFKQLFHYATQQPYSCLLCDNRANTPRNEQFIANPFSESQDNPPMFLVPKSREKRT